MLRTRAGALLLDWGFEEELIHFAHGQTLGEVIERAMLGAAVMTMALGFPASGKTLDHRGAEEIGGDVRLPEEKSPALAESQCGFACVLENPSHVYGEDTKRAAQVNEKENAPETRKCSTPCKH